MHAGMATTTSLPIGVQCTTVSYCSSSCTLTSTRTCTFSAGRELETTTETESNACPSETSCVESGGNARCIAVPCGTCGKCVSGSCIKTDIDKDGYYYFTPYFSGCDCNDNNANINPGKTELCNSADDNCNSAIDEGLQNLDCAELGLKGNCGEGAYSCVSGAYTACPSSSREVCGNGDDEDCDGYTDNEDMVCFEITGISATSPQIRNTKFAVECLTTLKDVKTSSGTDCAGARLQTSEERPRTISCENKGWDAEESKILFDCTASAVGTYSAICYAPTIKCLPDQQCYCTNELDQATPSSTEETMIISVLNSECSEYALEDECEFDSKCDWCPMCNGLKTSGFGISKCVDAGQCSYDACSTECGAQCDAETFCAATLCSSLTGCYNQNGEKATATVYGVNSYDYYDCNNVPNACSDNCGCSTNSCSNPLDCEKIVTDDDGDLFDTNCDGDCNDFDASIYPGAEPYCGGGIDDDCDGVSEETSVCCDIANSDDKSINSEGEPENLADGINILLPDFVRDYYWGGDCTGVECDEENIALCSFADTYDECVEKSRYTTGHFYSLKEYYATGAGISYKESVCPHYCNGQTLENIDFEISSLIEYAPGCSEGICVKESLKEECGEENLMIEYYCSGNLLKFTEKDCDDYDGFYDVRGESRYVDYDCFESENGGANCRANLEEVSTQGLNEGQVKVKLKNTGSLPFTGTIKLEVNNFCSNLEGFTIDEELNLAVYEIYEKTYNFLTQCTPVKFNFICETQDNYEMICVFGLGDGCGVFTKEQESFGSCDTCCGSNIQNELACSEQQETCDTSAVMLTVADVTTDYIKETITNAGWCCK